jgi:NAD(P)-dependent dehydrogenase (short-subunit alcohol dehydrogenase family)
VNALCPGPVETPLLLRIWGETPGAAERRLVHLPMGRMAQPREIVNAATFVVDGGLSAAYVTPE